MEKSMQKNNKPNMAIFTSANSGLAHYVTHLYDPLKKYVRPFYVTYSDAVVDDLVRNQVGKVYQLLKNADASSVLLTLRFLIDNKIKFINFHVGTTARKMYLYYVALLSQAKLNGIKVIGTLHDVMPFASFYIDTAALELLYSCFDYYIVGNEMEKNKLRLYFNVPNNKIEIIKHGPYLLFNNNRYSKESARTKLEIDQNKKVILFFGQLKPHKGLKFLLKAFKKISQQIPNTLLYISTDLSYSPELNDVLNRIEKTGVSKYIKLARGYVPSLEIEPIFKSADIVVLPYTEVSQSGILNLAFSFKKPVVVTNIFPEATLIDREIGRVAKPEDVQSLEDTIIEMLNNMKILEKYGENGYNYAVQKNSWDKAAGQINNIINKIK